MVDWIPVDPPFPNEEEWEKRASLRAFGQRIGESLEGVQIQLSDGETWLIGECNDLGGVCDDCMGFRLQGNYHNSPDTTIVAWRRLVSLEELRDD